MTRGMPWDDLPNMYEDSRKEKMKSQLMKDSDDDSRTNVIRKKPPHVFNLVHDAKEVGKRVAFGVTVSCPYHSTMCACLCLWS